ncbi:MAG TPA: DUF1993 family protein [Rudaea sp.]|jgi:hypothetical protein|nr:DUF1993 family protein [Rudaea sp.]
MTISMYDSLVPTINRVLKNLSLILDKGAALAEKKQIDGTVLTGSRLAPDMFPLSRQVQIACDIAKGAAARLSGTEIPKFEDTETTFPELKARIDKTLQFVNGIAADTFKDSEKRDIVLTNRRGDLKFTGLGYLNEFVLPNVYFHATAAYAILRHNGVEIGKTDFLGF